MAAYPLVTDCDPDTGGAFFDDAAWRKSSASEPNGGNCVEVNLGQAGLIGVRDTKLTSSPIFVFDAGAWATFLVAVKAGRSDLSS